LKTTTRFSLHTSRSGIGDFIIGGIHFPHSISSTTVFFFPIMFCSVLLRLAFLFYRKWQVLLSLGAPQYVLVPNTIFYAPTPIIIHCQNLKLKIRKYSMETLRGNSTEHRVSKLPRVAYVAPLEYPSRNNRHPLSMHVNIFQTLVMPLCQHSRNESGFQPLLVGSDYIIE